MPNTKSAKKRLRQSLERRANNRATKSVLRGQIRKVREAVKAGDLEQGAVEFRLASIRLDKAAAHHVIHANAAARVKSRLSALLKHAKAAGGAKA
jgi:small subunit ribosomal protein S20